MTKLAKAKASTAQAITAEPPRICHYGPGTHYHSPVSYQLPSHLDSKRSTVVVTYGMALLIQDVYEQALGAKDWKFMRDFQDHLSYYKRGASHSFQDFERHAHNRGYFRTAEAPPTNPTAEEKLVGQIGFLIAAREHKNVPVREISLEGSWHEARRFLPRRSAITLGIWSAYAALTLGLNEAAFFTEDTTTPYVMVSCVGFVITSRFYTAINRFRPVTQFHDIAMRLTVDRKGLIKLIKNAETTDEDVFTFVVDGLRDDYEKAEEEARREAIIQELWPINEKLAKIDAELEAMADDSFYYRELLGEAGATSTRSGTLEAQRLLLLELKARAEKLN